jgi:hypothetical protein
MERDSQDNVDVTTDDELSEEILEAPLESNVTTVTLTTEDELSEEILRGVSGGRSY